MRYLRITYTVTFPNKDVQPKTYENVLLATPDWNSFFSPLGGPSHFYLDDYTIVEDYGEIRHGSDEAVKLTIDVYAKYHKPDNEKVGDSAGWISPSGDFYHCRSWEHDSLAETICLSILGVYEGTRYLEKAKWLRLYDEGSFVMDDHEKPSQKQIDTLFDLAMMSSDSFKNRVLRRIGRG